jgi:hypothetical protein
MTTAPPVAQAAIAFGPAQLRLTDGAGKVLPEVHEVIDVADSADAPVCLGYSSFEDCQVVVNAGRRSDAPFVVTNPVTTSKWAMAEVEAMVDRGVVIELTGYALHRSLAGGTGDAWLAQAEPVLRGAGAEGAVVSSDSGIVHAPRSAEMLAVTWAALARAGVAAPTLERLFCTTPATLLGNALR